MEELNEIYSVISACMAERDIEEIKDMLAELRLKSRTCKYCSNQNGYGTFKGDICYSCFRILLERCKDNLEILNKIIKEENNQ